MGFLDEIISMRVKPKNLRYITLDSLRVMILHLTYFLITDALNYQ